MIELHDCFSANELITYEALGLAEEGEGHELVDAEATTYGGDGPVVNPSRRADLQGPPARRDRPRPVRRADLAAARRGRRAPGRGREGRAAAQHRPRRRGRRDRLPASLVGEMSSMDTQGWNLEKLCHLTPPSDPPRLPYRHPVPPPLPTPPPLPPPPLPFCARAGPRRGGAGAHGRQRRRRGRPGHARRSPTGRVRPPTIHRLHAAWVAPVDADAVAGDAARLPDDGAAADEANLSTRWPISRHFVVVYPDTDAVENAQPGPLVRCWQFLGYDRLTRGQGDPAALRRSLGA